MRALLLLLALSMPAHADVCADAARVAETAFGVPDGLLAAIGRVESGRRGPDGRTQAWPYAVNAAGRGYFLNTSSEAQSLVASLQAGGTRSVDVGCFQVNLLHHAGVFASLADGFDPERNATEAARFLAALHAQRGSWDDAVAAYHSATPAFGEPYRRMVMASLSGGPALRAAPVSRVASVVVIVPNMVETARTRVAAGRLPVVITPRAL